MSIATRQLGPGFVAEVSGIDLSRPLESEQVGAVRAAIDRYGVLVFHDQQLSDAQQIAFSRTLGPLEKSGIGNITAAEDRRITDDMADVSNLDKHGELLARDSRQRMFNLANRLWHSDSSFREIPANYSILSARSVPTRGGDTEFADMQAAYETLDEPMRHLIDDLVCEHSLMFSRGALGFTEYTPEERQKFAPVLQRLVRVHPGTGKKVLYLSSHAGAIVGWPVPEARLLLRELTAHATQPCFRFAHRWRLNDLVIWDNRRVMHRVRPFADTHEHRDMRRTTVAGEAPTVTSSDAPRAAI